MFTLAELHMRAYETVNFAIAGRQSDSFDCLSWSQSRSAVEVQMLQDLSSIRTLLGITKYEIRVAAKFPREAYAAVLDKIERIFRSLSLIGYSARAFNSEGMGDSVSAWMQELATTCPNQWRSRVSLHICTLDMWDGYRSRSAAPTVPGRT